MQGQVARRCVDLQLEAAQGGENVVGQRHRVKLGRDMHRVLAECMAVAQGLVAQGLGLRQAAARVAEPGTAMTVGFSSRHGTCGIAT